MRGKVNAVDIQNQYNIGERDFPKSQLRRIKWQQAQLRGINLQDSDLSYADLRDANLTNANLSNCYLNEANLTGANLTGANLTGAHLIKAYLTKTNFTKANLKEAYFNGSFLTKANLTKADLSGSILNGSHVQGATFQGAIYDQTTRFDRGFEPKSLGMSLVSSFPGSPTKKVTIAEIIHDLENIASITIHYLGGTITAKNFEDSRPNVDWLTSFTMDKKGKISFTESLNQQATSIQRLWLEKWRTAFVKKCSLIVQDLPNIIQDKNFNTEELIDDNFTDK
jgi:uncharacterized protein YjbI with pentapeptide repeats